MCMYICMDGDDGDELNVILSLALRSHYFLFAERALFMCMHIHTIESSSLAAAAAATSCDAQGFVIAPLPRRELSGCWK